MDHGGQFEREGRVMSQGQVPGSDLCDNLPSPGALTGNLNEARVLTQTQSHSPSKNEEGEERTFIQQAYFNNNGKGEGEQGKEAYRGQQRDEEEDTDEVMEEEESEGSSCLIRCQSPDTPMTDSSYSETGSLLETPCPFSPGTSPEPTSPIIPVVSPEITYPNSPVELSQRDAEVDSNTTPDISTTGSIACTLGPTCTMGPMDSTTQTVPSDTRLISPTGPSCITDTTDRIAKTTTFNSEQFTSSTEHVLNHEATYTTGPITSAVETSTVTTCPTRLQTSTASSATTEPCHTFTTRPTTTGTESTSSTGPITSNWENITSAPVPTYTTGPIPNPALLEFLEQLAQRGDDTHLPQYLHQVAEAFVCHEDYQRALWCIQLERLYHQRVLDNLNELQEQWESHCRRTSSDLATQHLDTLKHICQTHSRPRASDAVCASLDLLRPSFDKGGAVSVCTSARQVKGGMEQRAEDSSLSLSSHSLSPSISLADRLNSPEVTEKYREDPDRELEGKAGFHESLLNDKEATDREGGEAEGGLGYTISAKGNGVHPSTAGHMDQSKPAEQQGGDLDPAQEKEAKKEEERDVGQAAKALEMEDEGEEEEEEKHKGRDFTFCPEALPVETLSSKVEVQHLHQEALAEEKIYEETQLCQEIQEGDKNSEALSDAHLPHEAHMKHQEQGYDGKEEEEDEEEEEEEEDYELEQADLIREAASLDDMAKLITVEEMSPASGLVSILKKRSVRVDTVTVSASSEPQGNKPPPKRRVRFRVPDDGYEQDVGGGDSCLLLFLLCLVTVVISVGGTALYCALGDSHSSVCQDFSRNADFYISQIQRGIAQIQHWFAPAS